MLPRARRSLALPRRGRRGRRRCCAERLRSAGDGRTRRVGELGHAAIERYATVATAWPCGAPGGTPPGAVPRARAGSAGGCSGCTTGDPVAARLPFGVDSVARGARRFVRPDGQRHSYRGGVMRMASPTRAWTGMVSRDRRRATPDPARRSLHRAPTALWQYRPRPDTSPLVTFTRLLGDTDPVGRGRPELAAALPRSPYGTWLLIEESGIVDADRSRTTRRPRRPARPDLGPATRRSVPAAGRSRTRLGS